MSIESVLYTKENGYNPVIEFKTDGTLAFQLDANGGTGTFEISENNSIEIANLGWTDMCCDSEFSEKFVEMLLLVNSFSIEGNILKLFVTEWGWIELKLISD
jgi:heat shock protein HslJ